MWRSRFIWAKYNELIHALFENGAEVREYSCPPPTPEKSFQIQLDELRPAVILLFFQLMGFGKFLVNGFLTLRLLGLVHQQHCWGDLRMSPNHFHLYDCWNLYGLNGASFCGKETPTYRTCFFCLCCFFVGFLGWRPGCFQGIIEETFPFVRCGSAPFWWLHETGNFLKRFQVKPFVVCTAAYVTCSPLQSWCPCFVSWCHWLRGDMRFFQWVRCYSHYIYISDMVDGQYRSNQLISWISSLSTWQFNPLGSDLFVCLSLKNHQVHISKSWLNSAATWNHGCFKFSSSIFTKKRVSFRMVFPGIKRWFSPSGVLLRHRTG